MPKPKGRLLGLSRATLLELAEPGNQNCALFAIASLNLTRSVRRDAFDLNTNRE
jgi:hypothetical protein